MVVEPENRQLGREPRLRFYTADGSPLPHADEEAALREQAQRAQKQAEQRQLRAEREREQAVQRQLQAEREREQAERRQLQAEHERAQAVQERERAEQAREQAQQEMERKLAALETRLAHLHADSPPPTDDSEVR